MKSSIAACAFCIVGRIPSAEMTVGHGLRGDRGWHSVAPRFELRKGSTVRRYLEDFEVGETWESEPYEITEEEIITFARANDPQPMHTDPEAAANGRFGTVIASGWQVAALALKLFVLAGGYGETPILGLGADELRWKQVVRPGDRLRTRREVIEVRRSKSKPDRGILRTRVQVLNQNDEEVYSSVSTGQIMARSATA